MTLGRLCAGLLLGASLAAAADSPTNSLLNDYVDFVQEPIRNSELLSLYKDADLITVVEFDLNKLLAAKAETNAWVAAVPGEDEGFLKIRYKGSCGKQIRLQGSPKDFTVTPGTYMSQRCFAEKMRWLVFLKPVDSNGLYRCIDANPGGFRQYRGRDGSDERTMIAGYVNGRLVVESARGYHSCRMGGPSNMRDALDGASSGLNLVAAAKGGTAVELRFENVKKGPLQIPKAIELLAPMLWAEIEGPQGDSVLLVPEDYQCTRRPDPYATLQAIGPGSNVTVEIALPTGPVPKDATRVWAENNHAKTLAGSLPEGEHTVRFLFRPNKDVVVMSNPVKVTGKAGGATPSAVAAVPGFPAYEPLKPVKGLPALKKVLNDGSVKGEIWFDANMGGNWDLYRIDVNGSNLVNVTQTPDADEIEVFVSPNGKRILYKRGRKGLAQGGFWGRTSNEGFSFCVADRDGKNATNIVSIAGNPSWWDDNTLFYGSKSNGLCLHNLETGEIRGRLLKDESTWLGGIGGFVTSGAHKMLAQGGPRNALNAVPIVIDLDENAAVKGFTPLSSCYRGCTVRWASPAGGHVYFAHHDPKFDGEIVMWNINTDASSPERCPTPDAKWSGYGSFCESPDGTMYVIESWGNIWIGRRGTAERVELMPKPGLYCSPRWHAGVKE